MQEWIVDGLLILVILLATYFLGKGVTNKRSLTKKQRKMLVRIWAASILLLIGQLLGEKMEQYIGSVGLFLYYLIDYLVIGSDILIKAWKGIRNHQVFDESFLMAIATVGAFALAIYEQSGDYTEAIAVMLFYQIGSGSKVMQ